MHRFINYVGARRAPVYVNAPLQSGLPACTLVRRTGSFTSSLSFTFIIAHVKREPSEMSSSGDELLPAGYLQELRQAERDRQQQGAVGGEPDPAQQLGFVPQVPIHVGYDDREPSPPRDHDVGGFDGGGFNAEDHDNAFNDPARRTGQGSTTDVQNTTEGRTVGAICALLYSTCRSMNNFLTYGTK